MTTTTSTTGLVDGEIIKTDSLGRKQTTRQRREALLGEYERGTMTGQAFAQWAGINYSTFAGWLQRQRRVRKAALVSSKKSESKSTSEVKPMRWMEAVVEAGARKAKGDEAGLVVELPGGARLEIRDNRGAMLAAEVLRQLQRAAGC